MRSTLSLDKTDDELAPGRTLHWRFFRTVAFLELSRHFRDPKSPLSTGWVRMLSQWFFMPRPDGVVISMSVADLQAGTDTSHSAHPMRMLLDPLMKKLKRRLPVYLVLTDCESIPGFTAWMNALSPEQRQQALGLNWITPASGLDTSAVDLSELFSSLKAGLDNVRLSMFTGSEPNKAMPDVLALPENMMQLQAALQCYVQTLCEADIASVSGVLGGVWFTAREETGGQNKESVFLNELIHQVLPAVSQQREVEYLSSFRRYLSRKGGLTVTALMLILLVISGVSTLQLVAGEQSASVQDSIAQLQRIENAYQRPWPYLPFLMLLQSRQTLLEEKLVADYSHTPVNMKEVIAAYGDSFDQAAPAQQRTLILALAEAIATKQAMLDGATVRDVLRRPVISPELTLTGRDLFLSPEENIIVQRALLNKAGGADQVGTLRQLLSDLMSRDARWQWLLAPVADLPSIKLQTFFPGIGGQHELSNIWSAQGNKKIQFWLQELRAAAGPGYPLPLLDKFEQRQTAMRQSSWLKFILQLNRQPYPVHNDDRWTDLLLSMGEGNGPAMQFFLIANEQLVDIPAGEASPWLVQLRQIIKTASLANAGGLRLRVDQAENRIRHKLSSWLQMDGSHHVSGVSAAQVQGWKAWEKHLHLATSAALNAPVKDASLTQGLFSAEKSAEKNPLQNLAVPFHALRKTFNSAESDPSIDAIWALFDRDRQLLIAHAMQKTGCWLQDQWQKTVLLPLSKNAERMDYQAQHARAQKYLAAFMRGPARHVLSGGKDEMAAGVFEGQKVALTLPFLRLVNDLVTPEDLLAMPEQDNTRIEETKADLKDHRIVLEEQIKQLEGKPLELTLKSLPATIPGGAPLMPIGSEVHLFCDDQRSVLKSMNFGDQAVFRWRPGHCNRVTQVINFPGFQLNYNTLGGNAWPDFLHDVMKGQRTYHAEDFPQQAHMLQAQGIKKVVVRYQVDNTAEVQAAWQQWQALTQALEENTEGLGDLRAQKDRAGSAAGAAVPLSALPVTVASCPSTM